MKTSRVHIGGKYYTRVSGEIMQVEVTAQSNVSKRGRIWRVKRCDNGKMLEQLRAATALHDEPGPWY